LGIAEAVEPFDVIEDVRAVRDVADRVDRGENVDPGDVAQAIASVARGLPDAVGPCET
jgi:hypothetical protein